MHQRKLKKGTRALFFLLLIIYLASTLGSVEVFAASGREYVSAFSSVKDAKSISENSKNINISLRLYELFFGKQGKSKDIIYLIPGGDVFGIRMKENYITVNSAKEGSPFKSGDKILSVNGEEIFDAKDINDALSKTGSAHAKIVVIRDNARITLSVSPEIEDGKYKLGLTLREFACGIGTVTFIDKETGAFGGLGHGVCESDGGKLVEMKSGEVCGAILGSVKRGECGNPGELSGVLNKKHLGSINKNSSCGVFGVLSEYDRDREALPVGYKDEVKIGEAEIISTVKTGRKATYKIEIYEIDESSTGSKSFKIRVTDPTLIALTGGIVRGMSGSPIIQNGKLIGAVTHVMVADPTEGYGIFIENMLKSAETAIEQKAA